MALGCRDCAAHVAACPLGVSAEQYGLGTSIRHSVRRSEPFGRYPAAALASFSADRPVNPRNVALRFTSHQGVRRFLLARPGGYETACASICTFCRLCRHRRRGVGARDDLPPVNEKTICPCARDCLERVRPAGLRKRVHDHIRVQCPVYCPACSIRDIGALYELYGLHLSLCRSIAYRVAHLFVVPIAGTAR